MTGPAPAVAAARSAVRAALRDLPAGALVLVACSGGADSLALAAATAFVAPRAGLRAGSVTVDHGLRPGSGAEASATAQACGRLGLAPALVREVVVPPVGAGGPEAAARTVRYAALSAAAEELGAAAVLLGHTLDDQAETVLLGLARGSGARSLAGMAPRRDLLRRPLLGLRRGETEAVCRTLGLDHVEDPSNSADGPWRAADGSALRRAAVRERVLPALAAALGPGVPEALARTADQLRADADLLDALAGRLLAEARAAAPSAGAASPLVTAPDGAASPLVTAPDGAASPVVAPPDGAASPVVAPADGAASPAATARPGGPAHDPPPAVVLAADMLAAAHPALRSRALRLAALAAGVPAGSLGSTHVNALETLVTDYRGQGPAMLPGGVLAARRCGRLTLVARET
ncbi:tRNA lysidine(34) synthetase TilS [Georgenia wangjunii]|uniref:tRNA lysidine(34) synthetase TilS n=1 Tax=Georgenia wangjunii TaxID=3117730 RepID=UPI002F26A9F5